ncbi:rab11 family-interacting protein 1 [Hoplias malabaricus]|uniref:rab11 family-interacting protein 1 n=1 Tax=Hoplias malabaricus TaxID=27720 RepID=UPI003462CDF5
MPLISLDDDDPRWVPTHVNVTVLRARGLRSRGKQGSRYVYTVIQVGKEKYTTGLVEKAEEPEWKEECSFELLPGLLEGLMGSYPPGSSDLVFTVMHRVLIGLDVFLGQTVVPLDKAFQDGMCPRNEWLKLRSKPGRKEKERGELQVTVQFTRNNMTASMYDLTIKDKPRSAFGKLKDRVTGKKRGDVESSSAILPGRYAALSSSATQSLQENGSEGNPGPEEHSEDRRSKVKDFFLKGKLRKNSDTRSCSSLASESSMASSTGDPFVPIEICSTPIYSSRVMEPFHTDLDGGGKVMTHKRAYSDEASKVVLTSRPSPAVENLKGQNTLLSKSSLCINGSHVYSSDPSLSKGPSSVPVRRSLLEKCSPLSRSLQNLTRRTEDPQKTEGKRWIIDKSKKETAGSEDHAQETTTSAGKPILATAPLVVTSGGTEGSDKGKRPRKTLFSSSRSDSLPAKPEQAAAPQEGRIRGWFVSSDSQNKPRLGVSPKVENCPDSSSPLPPCFPSPPPSTLPLASSTGHVSPPSVSHHTNPFSQSSPSATSISSNPFLTRLQRNPFFEELIAEEALKSPTEMSCYPNFPYSNNSTCVARPGHSSPASNVTPSRMASIKRERPRSVARQRSLPTLMPGKEEAVTVNSSNANVKASRPLSESGGELDDFEAFATSRLKSPMGTPTRPTSGSIPPSPPSCDQMEQHGPQPNNGIMVENVNQRIPKLCDLPPLPPRMQTRTQFPEQEVCSDSWLDRGQELAVQKEASVLFQTGLASLKHVRERSPQVSPRNKESFMYFHCAALEQNINVCPHTAQLPTDGNLNLLQVREERVLAESSLSPNLTGSNGCGPVQNVTRFGLAEYVTINSSPKGMNRDIQETFVFTESDNTVSNTPSCLSDYDTTISESLCTLPKSSYEVNSKSEPNSAQQVENITTACALTTRDSNNNTNDPTQFAFIDSDNSLSDVIQGTFAAIHNNKSSVQQQDYDFSGNMFLNCRSSPGIPENVIKSITTELEMFSPVKTLNTNYVHKDVTSQQANSTHLKDLLIEGPCNSLKGHDTCVTQPRESVSNLKDLSSVFKQTEREWNLRAESDESAYKDSFVSPQSAFTLNSDDGNPAAQFKPEAASDNAGLGVDCKGGGCLTYDELKTETAELNVKESNCEVPSSNTVESGLTHENSISFEELHAQVAPRSSKSPFRTKTEVRSARIRTYSNANPPKDNTSTVSFTPLHDSACSFSYLPTGTLSEPNTVPDFENEMTSLAFPPNLRPGLGSLPTLALAPSTSTARPQVAARHTLSPEEAQPASSPPPLVESSPHPVKPLNSAAVQGEKRSDGRSVLEKLRSSIHPGRASQLSTAEPDKTQICVSEAQAHYQTLTNMELIALLLQQEMDAEQQREEVELQATLLEKRETELKKLKVQVRDLEDYIDKLLVRIMEQTPTLLQVRARPK